MYDSASKEVFQLGTCLFWSQGSCLCSPVFDIMVAQCLSINKPATFHFDHINAVVKVYYVNSYSVWFWFCVVGFFFFCVKQTFVCLWNKCTGVSGLCMITNSCCFIHSFYSQLLFSFYCMPATVVILNTIFSPFFEGYPCPLSHLVFENKEESCVPSCFPTWVSSFGIDSSLAYLLDVNHKQIISWPSVCVS